MSDDKQPKPKEVTGQQDRPQSKPRPQGKSPEDSREPPYRIRDWASI